MTRVEITLWVALVLETGVALTFNEVDRSEIAAAQSALTAERQRTQDALDKAAQWEAAAKGTAGWGAVCQTTAESAQKKSGQ